MDVTVASFDHPEMATPADAHLDRGSAALDHSGGRTADTREGAKLRIVVVGAGGRLGSALVREWREEFSVHGIQPGAARPRKLARGAGSASWSSISSINAAALTNVDYCEDHRDRGDAVECGSAATAGGNLPGERGALHSRQHRLRLRRGKARALHRRGCGEADQRLRRIEAGGGAGGAARADPEALVVRVSWVFGPDRPSFVDTMLKKGADGREDRGGGGQIFHARLTRATSRRCCGPCSIAYAAYSHIANGGACSWQEYAAMGARLLPSFRRADEGEDGRRRCR